MQYANHKILIANRGEIAVRIIQACTSLGLDFVCVHTPVDSQSRHCSLARELGKGKSLYTISSYLDANEIFAVADASGATAIHPGYGFFAEDYRFARRAVQRQRKLIFIGPSWQVIRELGDKINTKRLARRLGIPTVPGSDRPMHDEIEAEELAKNLFAFQKEQGIANPVVLVKAAVGGGGMGIEEVDDFDKFRTVLRSIRNYGKRQFQDDGVLIEQRIFDFNHLEVQIVADRSGKHMVHYGTRNCSIQSTGRQKRLEVAPGFDPHHISYAFDAKRVLADITEYSLRMAREVGYDNVGTWEWIVSPTGEPFLMEVNTRIQVENGVSAAIARRPATKKINLLAEQIRLGLGDPLGYSQQDISFEGVGIEYRILAEDPQKGFVPWVGTIETFSWETRLWADVYTHVPLDTNYEIPTEYDPNLALVIIWGKDLHEARQRGLTFLNQMQLKGYNASGDPLRSNVEYLKTMTRDILVF